MTFNRFYYNGELRKQAGLTITECDEGGLDYEYNMLLVVHHTPSNRVFVVQDAGCSCPVPFAEENWDDEDHNSLEEVTLTNLDDVIRRIDEFPAHQDDRQAAINVLRNVLKG